MNGNWDDDHHHDHPGQGIDQSLAAGAFEQASDCLATAYASLEACGRHDLAREIPAVLTKVRQFKRQVGAEPVRVRIVGGRDPADWWQDN